MTEKHCGHHEDERRVFYRRIFAAIAAFLVLFAVVVLIVFLVLQPRKPRFLLQDVTVYAFNVSSPPSPSSLTTNMQVTVSTRNPNDRIGVFYEKLDIYASYRNQQCSLATGIPQTYQGHNDAVIWSPFLQGNDVPVSPILATALEQDQNAGMVLVSLKINGRVKWKVGSWISGTYHLFVNCPAYISFGKQSTGIAVGPAMKYQLVQSCAVDVSTG